MLTVGCTNSIFSPVFSFNFQSSPQKLGDKHTHTHTLTKSEHTRSTVWLMALIDQRVMKHFSPANFGKRRKKRRTCGWAPCNTNTRTHTYAANQTNRVTHSLAGKLLYERRNVLKLLIRRKDLTTPAGLKQKKKKINAYFTHRTAHKSSYTDTRFVLFFSR